MSNSESNTNTNLWMPVAFLLVLLAVPLIHSYMHSVKAKYHPVYPLLMKIPVDSSIITAPSEAKQYEDFEVKLNLDTQKLAKFLGIGKINHLFHKF